MSIFYFPNNKKTKNIVRSSSELENIIKMTNSWDRNKSIHWLELSEFGIIKDDCLNPTASSERRKSFLESSLLNFVSK